MKSLQVAQDPGSPTDRIDQVSDKSIVIPNKLITIADSFKGEHSWFIAPQIPSDFSIQVQETTYNVHKYPLISKCGYIGRLEVQPLISNSGNALKLENFPGGSETFETILKFCYGLPIDFSPDNIAALRCASEFLEMTEELEDGNLISKTEAFLTFVVLSSWKDTITVLKSCENLSPWAENLQIVRRCCDSIAWKASKDEPTSEDATTNQESWWFNDVATFRIDHFMRIISAIRAKGTKQETIGKCIMQYAKRWLPGMDVELEGLRGYGHEKSNLQFSIFSGKKKESTGHSKEQRAIIESLISIIPAQQEAVSCKFLLRMLKMAMMYSVSPALTTDLEKRVSMVLEDAEVNDLLIPRYQNGDQGKTVNSTTNTSEECTMQDIDVVQRIIEYFLMHEQQQTQHQQKSRKFNISRLLDNYLAEIARDPNLSITKFQVLAELLPENTRSYDDGLYRAIDTYLKTHPSLTEHDRRRLCKIMNCEKLSLDACMHAAQNERLPLRTVVQVLFSEQIKMRAAMQEKEPAQSGIQSEQEGNQTSATMDIKALKAELESVKSKMVELQNDYFELQQEYEKLSNKPKNSSGWTLNWRKIKNSLHIKPTGVDIGDRKDSPKSPNTTLRRGTPRRRLSMS
ncbi:BTB/POZ domain-containing protein DOT3 isoform X1 [Abrus precatorius]|uniref:BTB/POZ domain-containing protein DOT3 isoform X1 n=1 Tax=Abrus precatorius TaxID=3816 RepID=A0A8B8MAA7_ABRPR|nr:BTB/POZ domain-containing protein DOT3 isoform X1 [Abrus precatorius]